MKTRQLFAGTVSGLFLHLHISRSTPFSNLDILILFPNLNIFTNLKNPANPRPFKNEFSCVRDLRFGDVRDPSQGGWHFPHCAPTSSLSQAQLLCITFKNSSPWLGPELAHRWLPRSLGEVPRLEGPAEPWGSLWSSAKPAPARCSGTPRSLQPLKSPHRTEACRYAPGWTRCALPAPPAGRGGWLSPLSRPGLPTFLPSRALGPSPSHPVTRLGRGRGSLLPSGYGCPRIRREGEERERGDRKEGPWAPRTLH